MKHYERICRKYEGICEKYEEISSRGGECYAYADTIPEMAPSTEREGGSPAKTG